MEDAVGTADETNAERHRRKSSRSELVLFYFLRKGNDWVTPTLLHRKLRGLLREEEWEFLGEKKIRAADISQPSVFVACRDWAKKGMLESMLATPPRRKARSPEDKTPQYRLPTDDLEKRIAVAKFFLLKMSDPFVKSAYGMEFIDEVAVPMLEASLETSLSSSDRRLVVAACRKTPCLLQHIVFFDFPWSLRKIDATRRKKRSDLVLLRKYMRSLRVVECVEQAAAFKSVGKLRTVDHEEGGGGGSRSAKGATFIRQ